MMLGSDQPTHAARVRSLGVGVRLHSVLDNYTGAGIASAIQEAVQNQSIRANLAKWSTIQRAGGNSRVAADWLERAAQPGGLVRKGFSVAEFAPSVCRESLLINAQDYLADHSLPYAGLDVLGVVLAVLYIVKRTLGALMGICCYRRRSASSSRKPLLKME